MYLFFAPLDLAGPVSKPARSRGAKTGKVVKIRNSQLAELGRKTPKQAHVTDQASSPAAHHPAMRPSAWLHSASYISSAPRAASKNYPTAPASTPPSPAPPGRPCRSARACLPPRSGHAARPRSIGGVPRSLQYRSRPGGEGRRLLTRCCVGGRGSRRGGRRRGSPAHR